MDRHIDEQANWLTNRLYWAADSLFDPLRLTHRLIDWLTCWPTDWLTDWLADRLTGLLPYWLTNSSTHRLFDSLTHWVTDWVTYLFINTLAD